MARYVFTVNLKDDAAAIEAYRRYHREVWPEVIQSLRRAGVQHRRRTAARAFSAAR